MSRRKRANGDEDPAAARTQADSGCEADQRRREFGYRIASRPRRGEVVWVRDGKRYPQSEVDRRIAAEIKRVER